MSPIAVRRGTGPVHLAFPTAATSFQAVCGAKFRGINAVVPAKAWRRDRRCDSCTEKAKSARTDRELARIAGRSA